MGRVDVTRRFRSVCEQCRNELYEETERTKRELPKDLAQVIDRYIIPILGDFMCHNVTRDVLQQYSNKRQEMMGRNPSSSTVATHNTALNYIFGIGRHHQVDTAKRPRNGELRLLIPQPLKRILILCFASVRK